MILPLKLDLNQMVPVSPPSIASGVLGMDVQPRHCPPGAFRCETAYELTGQAVESLVGGDGFEPPTSCV